MEQRTLKAAYKFYLNKELENAHEAEADTIATFEILEAQLDRYADTDYTDKEGNKSIPVINNILIRNKHTLPQVKLENSKQRKQNIKQAFSLEVRPRQLDFKNKTIILIDDISTTGRHLKRVY